MENHEGILPDRCRRLADDVRAFTLVEIILVLLILTVIAGLSAPSLSKSLTKHQFDKTADQLINLMRYAQSRAITRSRPVRLEFNSGLTEFWLTEVRSTDPAVEESNEFERLPGRMGVARRVPAELAVRIDAHISGLTFYPDGRMDKAELAVCKEKRCKIISTRIQRGFIRSFDSEGYS
ncbi:MAG: GspH/FimT family pseudopilin [Candidatus Omnitrophica bacterium]|nr:GspH/FimT family pseudopilin [Candidatus Omnitrophota bacterium]MCB9722020.1 GspH/FimT family pseudopilin [Candidatus Omnitrophota bacterium]